jgi:hypothetical protein
MGGETLSGTVDLLWFALDDHDPDLDIYLYYLGSVGKIAGPIANTGEYSWDTTSVSDGTYDLKVEALNDLGILNFDSATVTIDNGYAGVKVSNVLITDTSIGSTQWVKNGDTVEITADITGGQTLDRLDITADLSGFGLGTSFFADSFDGHTARWLVTDVSCNPSDGLITVTITADGESNSATITADNNAPEVTIIKPDSGLYLFNTRLLPIAKTVIVGPITIEISADDNSGTSTVEFYVDDDRKATITEEPFDWYLNLRLLGEHTLKAVVFDGAGNTATAEQTATIWNIFGN